MVKTAGCGSVMRGFESHYPPHINYIWIGIGVSPSGKAMDSDSIMRRFESCYPSQENKYDIQKDVIFVFCANTRIRKSFADAGKLWYNGSVYKDESN